MVITVEIKQGQHRFLGVDIIPNEVSAHDALATLEKTLSELKNPERQAMGGSVIGVTHGLFFNMKLNNLNRDKLAKFTDIYANFLHANFKANPLDYMGSYENTFSNMKFSIVQGTFNKDSESFKQTCKALKIKHTYKAIDEFLERK